MRHTVRPRAWSRPAPDVPEAANKWSVKGVRSRHHFISRSLNQIYVIDDTLIIYEFWQLGGGPAVGTVRRCFRDEILRHRFMC